MPFNLRASVRKFSVKRKQTVTDIPRKLNPEQVRVGYKTEMSHKERQQWLKTRTYSQNKPVHPLSVS